MQNIYISISKPVNKLYGFIGQAGTGKTTQIIAKLEELSAKTNWSDNNAVLALTFMHGSRRRLSLKLKILTKQGIHVDCQTIDSFCFYLVQRYKRYLGINKPINISDSVGNNDFIDKGSEIFSGIGSIQTLAIKLLSFKTVQESINISYPIVIVDEFQDCQGSLLEFIKLICPYSNFLIGSDDFQKLDKSETSCPATDWLKSNAEVTLLEIIHRTKNEKVLHSAKSLRTNTNLTPGVDVIAVTSSALAAWNIAKYINWNGWGKAKGSLAVISPTKSETDTFFKETLDRLKSPFEKNSFPATYLHIENDLDETVEEILESLDQWKTLKEVKKENLVLWEKMNKPVVRQTIIKVSRLLNIRGKDSISKEEFSELISRQKHQLKVFGISRSEPKKIALTVHQAKNREFDYVIILWSYKNQGGDLYSRKVLYNAVTRAKKDAVIIIQFNPVAKKIDTTIALVKNDYNKLPAKKVTPKKASAKKAPTKRI